MNKRKHNSFSIICSLIFTVAVFNIAISGFTTYKYVEKSLDYWIFPGVQILAYLFFAVSAVTRNRKVALFGAILIAGLSLRNLYAILFLSTSAVSIYLIIYNAIYVILPPLVCWSNRKAIREIGCVVFILLYLYSIVSNMSLINSTETTAVIVAILGLALGSLAHIGFALLGFALMDEKKVDQSVVRGSSMSQIDSLEKLSSLRNQGIISQEEFETKKKEILNR